MENLGIRLVESGWVAERLASEDFLPLDPRSSVRYLSGHLRNAVSVPWVGAFGAEDRMRQPAELAHWLGGAGLDDSRAPLIYDGADGRYGALLAWILVYLGRRDVYLMNVFLETWRAEGRELFYRPVEPVAREFCWRADPALRARREDVAARKLLPVDFRGFDEFSGAGDGSAPAGHIPGARHLSWQEVAGDDGRLLAPPERLSQLARERGIAPGSSVAAYCLSGPRAALGFLALSQIGCHVQLYDGSWHDWTEAGMPVEK